VITPEGETTMNKNNWKAVALLTLISFAPACSEAPVYVAPEELSGTRAMTVRTKDGKEWEFASATLKEDRIVGRLRAGSDQEVDRRSIEAVLIKKGGKGTYVILGLDAALALGLIVGMSVAPSPPPSGSCPLVYSFDGTGLVLEAEPYGGAVLQALQRTEWIAFSSMKDVGGRYVIRAANELSETEYIDELKLIVVDHAPGTRALPDTAGGIHVISRPVPPLRAETGAGIDVGDKLAATDRLFWEPSYPDAPPSGPDSIPVEALREELIIEFPKPAGVQTAKLVANAWTTPWGPQAAGRVLRLHGADLPRWTASVNARGPEYFQAVRWLMTEELYMLKAEVETRDGWKPRAVVLGGGPIVAREKVYVLDISDVPGDILRIRIRPPSGFWRFDAFAVDYGVETPASVMEISASAALDRSGRDVRETLSSVDGRYLVMPDNGDYADLDFAVPPALPGTARTVILKANGYYDPRISASGEPRLDLIQKIHSEPGATLRFAYQEYLKDRENGPGKRIR
jgi:hypothetical protein